MGKASERREGRDLKGGGEPVGRGMGGGLLREEVEREEAVVGSPQERIGGLREEERRETEGGERAEEEERIRGPAEEERVVWEGGRPEGRGRLAEEGGGLVERV